MTASGIVLLVLGLVGFWISSYFTLLSYRWIQPRASWLPSFCQLGERTCAQVIFTPRARLFGVPNSLLGQCFYLALGVGVPLGLVWDIRFWGVYLAASLATVLVGLFLTYSLLFITRIPCPLCFTSHGLNLLIFLVLLLGGPG